MIFDWRGGGKVFPSKPRKILPWLLHGAEFPPIDTVTCTFPKEDLILQMCDFAK